MFRRPLLAALGATSLAGTGPAPLRAETAAPLTVFAAASLQDALRTLEPAWRAAAPGNPPLRFSFAASSALARQIEQGAPADLFMSADEDWMDYLAERRLILPATRVSPLGNALVLVAPADSTLPALALGRATDLSALLGPGRLAAGDPAHVPAGRYARQALEWMGQWQAIGPRLARADNVRSALLLVERGEAPLGIVYATDAQASQRGSPEAGRGIRVIGTFPGGSHAPVTYPFAATRRAEAHPQALAALAFLAGPAAAAAWQGFGFSLRAP